MTWCTYVVGLGEFDRRPGVRRGLAVPTPGAAARLTIKRETTVFRGFSHSHWGR